MSPDRPADPAPSEPPGDQGRDLPEPPASTLLSDALVGHWFADGQVGNCIALRDWYSFTKNAAVSYRGIDHNACSAPQVLSLSAGRWSLSGRQLEIALDAAGSDRAYGIEPPPGVGQRLERMTIAIGERPASASSPAQTFLDGQAFSGDGEAFVSERSIRFAAVTGVELLRQDVKIGMRLEPGLPAEIGDALTVRVKLALSELASPNAAAQSDTFELEYGAVVRDAPKWRRIAPTALEGLSTEDAITVWNALLDDAGLAGHPEWAQRLVRAHFYPSQRYDPDDSAVLTSTLPDYGRWTRSATPPPQPGPLQ